VICVERSNAVVTRIMRIALNNMIATNKKTGEDVTHLYTQLILGKITNKEFEEATGLEPAENNPSRKEWLKRNK